MHPECASRRDGDSFEPRDAVKGDIARMLFYMDVHYAGADGVPDLALIDEDSRGGPLLGHLCTLLAWHEADPGRRTVLLLAYFGYPRSHEDDAEHAVRAGHDLVAMMREIDAAVAHAKGASLHVCEGGVAVKVE